MYTYKAKVVRIIDGDTIVVNIDLGLKQWSHDQHLRIKDIYAPEVRTKDLEEKKKGLESKSYLEGLLPYNTEVIVKTYKHSFNRYVADVWINYEDDSNNIADIMVKSGFASRTKELTTAAV